MIRLPIQIFVLSVIAVSSVIAIKGYDVEFLSFNILADRCVGESGDQERCDNFLACTKKFPKRLDDEFHTCIKNNYPGGTLNKCTDSQNLFGSEDVFNKYLLCFLNKLPEKSSLSSEEAKQFYEYKKCIQKEGGKCFKDRGVPS